MIRRATFALIVIVSAKATLADGFEVKSAAPPSVTFGGVPLIVNDAAEPEFTARPNVSRVAVKGWDAVFHVWRAGKAAKTRVEVGASSDTVEYTFVRLVEADIAGFVRYSFLVPHEFLDGHAAEVLGTPVKVSEECVEKRRIVGPLGPDTISYVKPILYLRVKHPKGDLDFDFNPRGFWTGAKTVTPHAAEWAMRRTEEGYLFWTAFSRTHYGTLQEFKFIIRRADTRPIEEVHPRAAVRWTNPYRDVLMLNVGEAPVEGYDNVMAGSEGASPARWRNSESVRLERDERFRETGQTRYEGASPVSVEGGAVLEIDVGREGYYLVNMLVGAADRPVGPCEINGDGGRAATCPALAAGEYDSWAMVAFAEHGRIVLRFSGDFRLAAVGVAPMMYENEDFLFRRSWWLSPERHPGDILPD